MTPLCVLVAFIGSRGVFPQLPLSGEFRGRMDRGRAEGGGEGGMGVQGVMWWGCGVGS